VQVASLISSVSSSLAQSCSGFGSCQSSASGLNAGQLLWGEVIFAALAAAMAGWQWYKSNQDNVSVSKRATTFVLIFGLLSLALLLYQVVGLQSSTLGVSLVSLLGIGYWAMVLAVITLVLGAIAQLRAS